MADAVHRLNVSLDGERAAKLSQLAEQVHLQEGTLARSLLSQAIDDAAPNVRHITELLDGIAGALDRARLGLIQAESEQTIPLDQL